MMENDKVSKESEDIETAHDKGVTSTDLLGFKPFYFIHNIGYVLFKYIQFICFWCAKKTMGLFFLTGFMPLLILVPHCVHFADLTFFDFSPNTNDIVSLRLKESVHDEKVVMFPILNVDKTISKGNKPRKLFFILSGLFGTQSLSYRVT